MGESMATARKTTKEVTTTQTVYTLELSEKERDSLAALLDTEGCEAEHISIYRALCVNVQPSETSRPLAVGDEILVLRNYPCNGPSLDDIVQVLRSEPDDDNEIYVDGGYLPADGEDIYWERV
jgi:hypothetical protein